MQPRISQKNAHADEHWACFRIYSQWKTVTVKEKFAELGAIFQASTLEFSRDELPQNHAARTNEARIKKKE